LFLIPTLQVHVEIGLPSEAGRVQILQIHTKSMREHGLLEQAVIDDFTSR
jgi:vesicle-fusing ATPase